LDKSSRQGPQPDVLVANMQLAAAALKDARPARIGLLGQPGAGKSSLLLALTGGRCVPPPKVGPMTNETDWSKSLDVPVVHTWAGLTFVDTPGYGTPGHPVETYLDHFPFAFCDRLLLVLKDKRHQADDRMMRHVKLYLGRRAASRLIAVRSHCESLDRSEKSQIEAELKFLLGQEVPLVFLSCRTREGIATLGDLLAIQVPLPGAPRE